MTSSVAASASVQQTLPSLHPIMLPVTGLLLAQFTLVLSGIMVATSLPTLMGVLEGPHSHASWLVAATILTNTISIPVWGKLTDRLNPKLILILSLAIFVCGTVFASLTTTTWAMLVARGIQGIAIGGVAATVATSIVAGRFMSATARLRPVLVYGACVLLAGATVLGLALPYAPVPFALVGTILLGSGLGALAQNLVVAPQNRTPQEHVGSVTSTVMFMNTLGGAAGLVCLGAVLSSWVDPQLAAGVSPAEAYAHAVPSVFQLSALVILPAFACILALPRIRLHSAAVPDPADPEQEV